jgi:hypothetical protein
MSTLTACAHGDNAKRLEQSLAADPRLQNSPAFFAQSQAKPPQLASIPSSVKLPSNFPTEIPIYPNSTLESVTPAQNLANGSNSQKILTLWRSNDPSNFVTSFYSTQFSQNNWQILQKPTDDAYGSFMAKRNNLLVNVAIKPSASTSLEIEYSQGTNQDTSTAKLNSQNSSVSTPQPGDPDFIGPVLLGQSQAKQQNNDNQISQNTASVNHIANDKINNTSQINSTSGSNPQEFSDLEQAPPEWHQYIRDLASLGVLSVEPKTTNQFAPNKNVTRREYARWLVAANNAMYVNDPAKQIRLASDSSQPVFKDVSLKDADFPAIQGLASAGLIPSILSGDTTAVLFHPDAPLTREQMILWKVPLDTRQVLPSANLDAVKQTWGFQDAGKIAPAALRAVLADYQSGTQANTRRIFGYTTLFQPKKPVTRAEAAVSLWYFGTQSEGISASEGLKLKG